MRKRIQMRDESESVNVCGGERERGERKSKQYETVRD